MAKCLINVNFDNDATGRGLAQNLASQARELKLPLVRVRVTHQSSITTIGVNTPKQRERVNRMLAREWLDGWPDPTDLEVQVNAGS